MEQNNTVSSGKLVEFLARIFGDHSRNTTQKILILGDGNFSYSVALRKMRKFGFMVSTCFDSQAELEKKYDKRFVGENITFLQKNDVTVLHKVDATKLASHCFPKSLFDSGRPLLFDFIVFNFPHQGGRPNIKKSRNLLFDLFASAKSVLESRGKIIITLLQGQGGTIYDTVKREKQNTWKIVEAGASSDLIMSDCLPWVPLIGYESSGYKSTKRSFYTKNGMVHVFARDNLGFRSLDPPIWRHDISLWITDEIRFNEDVIINAIKSIAGPENILSIELQNEFRITPRDPKISDSKMLSQCFTILYQSKIDRALSKRVAANLQKIVRINLREATDGIVIVR